MSAENHIEPFIEAIAANVETLEKTSTIPVNDLKEFATKYLADSDVFRLLSARGELIGVAFIVNNQRTVMLRAMALLSRRVAADNPNDVLAQKAAEDAERDAREADIINQPIKKGG